MELLSGETGNQAKAKGPDSWQKSYAEDSKKKHLQHWEREEIWFSALRKPKIKLKKHTKKSRLA